MASLALMASAKPRHVPKVGFANGRIIGGHDAEPRKYHRIEQPIPKLRILIFPEFFINQRDTKLPHSEFY